MKGTRDLKGYLKQELRDKNFKQAFDAEEVYANLAIEVARLRQENGLTQKDLALALHTTQQTVSRLEDPANKSLSLNTLIRLAQALHRKVRIQFV